MTAFLHSHSYTANPLGCRAALATLELFRQMDTISQNRLLAQHLARALTRFEHHPHIAEVRQTGMIAALELVRDKQQRIAYPWQERRGMQVYQAALQRGVLLRPLGNVVYFMPPYIITPQEIDWMVDVAEQCIEQAVRS
jgi:adenosylmethionine---8-amino-7-oxononanoate aminotransferase